MKKTKNKKANLIILVIVALLLILLVILQMLMVAIEKEEPQNTENAVNVATGDKSKEKPKTIKDIIENAGSIYLGEKNSVYLNIYVNFKHNLYDDKGRSNEKYFNDMIDQIVDLERNSFYLIDQDKNIKIFVFYDKDTKKYKITINEVKDFFDETDGETYVKVATTKIVQKNAIAVTEDLYSKIARKSMKCGNTILASLEEREELPNGYFYYPSEHVKAKIQGPKVLNIVYDKNFERPIVGNTVFVTTKFEDILKKYKNPGFGGEKEGYLGYRTPTEYVFFYEDEVSVYSYKYEANEYFDKYLQDYCDSGDLDKLVSDFTTSWSTYFTFDYDAENQNLKLTFPTRGLGIDIIGNNSRGITIYNNYYLTDTVKELIKSNKITLEPNKDLLLITEQNRRESMK